MTLLDARMSNASAERFLLASFTVTLDLREVEADDSSDGNHAVVCIFCHLQLEKIQLPE